MKDRYTIEERYRHIVDWFVRHKGHQTTELEYSSVYELLVSVILSAQCTDKRVNTITPKLFERYPDVWSMADAEYGDVFELIRSVSYPNSKTRYLVDSAKMIMERFGGRIPDDVDELQTLPGVGRKTANVVASVAFGQPRMPVDTHIFRVARRLGISDGNTPRKVENDLTSHIPSKYIADAHHWLLLHGRYVCKARTPLCSECGIAEWCRYFDKKNNKIAE